MQLHLLAGTWLTARGGHLEPGPFRLLSEEGGPGAAPAPWGSPRSSGKCGALEARNKETHVELSHAGDTKTPSLENPAHC